MYMYVYQNSTEIEWRKKYQILTELDDHRDNDKPIPENLTIWTPEEEAKVRDYFFGDKNEDEKQKIKISKREDVRAFKQTFYAKTLFYLDKQVTHIRRGALVVTYAINDLLFSPDIENMEEIYTERSKILNQYESPFYKIIKENIDMITKPSTPTAAKTEL